MLQPCSVSPLREAKVSPGNSEDVNSEDGNTEDGIVRMGIVRMRSTASLPGGVILDPELPGWRDFSG